MRNVMGRRARRSATVIVAVGLLLALGLPAVAQTPRPEYVIQDPAFEALEGATAYFGTQTVDGEESGYRVEVPDDWNGDLVLYSHGFVSPASPDLVVENPPLREYFISQGYAWAASSYRANGYVIDAGIEDTHALLENWSDRTEGSVDDPETVYFHGFSMGGHITGAAIERRPDAYDGAYPLCGVMGDLELYDYFLDVVASAGALADVEVDVDDPTTFLVGPAQQITSTLGLGSGPGMPSNEELTHPGLQYRETVEILSGGERPLFDEAFDTWLTADETTEADSEDEVTFDITIGETEVPFLLALYGGALSGGIDDPPGIDTLTGNAEQTYTFSSLRPLQQAQLPPDAQPGMDGARALSPEEMALNAAVARRTADPDGTVPFPQIEGDLPIPTLTLHTLGDLFVPFSMQQVYAERAQATGTADLLVQRAIRATGHCDFSPEELVAGFDDLVAWVETDDRPVGDDVRDAAVVADRSYGCAFTEATRPGTQPCEDLVGSVRVAGEDRIATAVQVSRETWPQGAPTAILARSDVPADALAGSALSGRYGIPVLLTPPGVLDDGVQDELLRLGAQEVILLGSEQALSAQVEQAVEEAPGDVSRTAQRVEGPNRYATAAAIAARVVEGRPVRHAFVARGDVAADALAVSGLAAFLSEPVLLATPDGLRPPTVDALQQLGIESVTLVGSADALSLEVERQLGALGVEVRERLAGDTRYGTSAAVAERSARAGMSRNSPVFANGEGFADAVVGGPAAAERGDVFVLANGDVGPGQGTLDALGTPRGLVGVFTVVGGPAAVSDEVVERLELAVQPSG